MAEQPQSAAAGGVTTLNTSAVDALIDSWDLDSEYRDLYRKGIAGIVIEGSIRDTDALREMRFPVWSTSISAAHDEKRGPAAVNVPIVVSGVAVKPGDVICADGDGVLAIPRHLLAGAVAGARVRAAKEVEIREKLKAGKTLFEIMGIQSLIEASGAVP